jgi:hypothetical protein
MARPCLSVTSVIVLVLVSVLCASIAATPDRKWSAQSLPNPRLAPAECGSAAAGSVCDPDGILRPETVQKLNDAISGFANTHAGPCGESNK